MNFEGHWTLRNGTQVWVKPGVSSPWSSYERVIVGLQENGEAQMAFLHWDAQGNSNFDSEFDLVAKTPAILEPPRPKLVVSAIL